MRHRFDIEGADHRLWLAPGDGQPGAFRLILGDASHTVRLEPRGGHHHDLVVDGASHPVVLAAVGDTVHVFIDGAAHAVRLHDPIQAGGAPEAGGHALIRAPMPGTVLEIAVDPGAVVQPGDRLIVIESMKLETTIRATASGSVDEVRVRAGQSFDRDAVLVTLTLAGEEA
ncbi:acetyl-CoA carboxylase biotin carboxyl carrier protein subunit [Chelatococcus reniformis]|uniref:Lipoyl-binding domain-containing protein n=1 Tax=Chelatococcus reniformis TaxID=1494448 RepID=A0A916TYN0_9HYPH|nr:acetyl-CoA carboxylase biotin carboxyl carrier protein subunit [Chelatococcus reniformis]GGC52811.1 hypothetical protein GCM10010994_09880 [Chelatococcus reniformis]